MDSVIDGLNKVICRTAVTNDGQTVTIANSTNTYTSDVSGGIASFMIPSVPAPAKTSYTVTLGGYSRVIELGYGDSIDITLDADHEPAYQGDISNLQDQIDAGLTTAEVAAVRALLTSLNGKTLVSASQTGTTLYLTSIV